MEQIFYTYTPALFGLLLVAIAARQRAIFECIILFDSVKDKLGTIRDKTSFWSKASFDEQKDRNHDGRASWLELTFPHDGGHRVKNAEIALLCTSGFGIFQLGIIEIILYIILSFMIYGYSFDQNFKYFRQ